MCRACVLSLLLAGCAGSSSLSGDEPAQPVTAPPPDADAGAAPQAVAGAAGGGLTTGGASGAGPLADAAAAPPDAGSGDSGTADAGAQDGSTAVASSCAGASFCETFEAVADLGAAAHWEVSQPNCSGTGALAIDAAQAHGGSRSLRVDGAAGYCNHIFFGLRGEAAALPAPLYARLFVRLQSPLGAGHVTFVALHDASEDRDLRLGGQSEILMWNRESDDATLPELSPAGIALSVEPEAGAWLCVEFALDAAGTLQTWVDGQPVAGLVVEGEPTPDVDSQWQRKADWSPQPTDLRLGFESYAGDANTLWFDDIAIGTARIGCGS